MMRISFDGIPPLAYGPVVGTKVYTAHAPLLPLFFKAAGTITYVSPKGLSVHTSRGERFGWVAGLSAYLNDNDVVLRAF